MSTYWSVSVNGFFCRIAASSNNALDNYSLKGKSAEIEKNLVESVPLLGQLALRGQSTVFYAAPNNGKTLITIYLLIEAIKKGWVDPSQVYYLNMDDDSQGLFQKLQIAEEYGFHMLAEGYLDFTSNEFAKIIINLIENDEAQGIVIILDTLKKFINLMDKTRSSRFTKIIAQFIAKGGTVVALAHTNKNPGEDGKPVPGGTSDIIDDFSCAYTLATVSSENDEKVVVFENKKQRGNIALKAAYRYCVGDNVSYTEILASVSSVDEQQVESLKQAEQVQSDGDMIEVITACINDGIITKMKLADAVAKQAQVSKRAAIKVIEKYSGDDPEKHKWCFTVIDRGAKAFSLLVPS